MNLNRVKIWRFAAAHLLLPLYLMGCVSTPTVVVKQSNKMLDYYQRLLSLNPAELERERNELDIGGVSPLYQAVFFTLLQEPYRDEKKARQILGDYLSRSALREQNDLTLAMLLLQMLDERKHHSEKYQSLNQKLSQQQGLAKRLSQQLEELKAIEQTINEREQPTDTDE